MSSTITVTATVQDPSSTSLAGNCFVRFRLRNFAGFVPQVSGTSILPEIQVDAAPVAGAISQTLWPNNAITPSTTFYTVELWNQGRITSSGNYIFNANTSLNSASQVNTPPVPAGFSLVLENNGVLNSSQSTLNIENTDGSVIITDLGAGTLNIQTGKTKVLTPSGFWVAHGNSADQNNAGQSGGFYLGNNSWASQTATLAATVPTATTPAAMNVKPNSSSGGSGGGFGSGSVYLTNVQSVTSLRWSLRLNQTTSMRIWMGATLNAAASFKADTLSTAFAGFRYSTNAGDTSYQCVTNTGSAQTTTAETTASHVDSTTFHVFEIQFVSPNILFYIDGVLVGSQSTNLPTAATLLGFQTYIDNVGSVGQPAYDLAWVSALANF